MKERLTRIRENERKSHMEIYTMMLGSKEFVKTI